MVTTQVEIRDGQPEWYLSSDIWVVPGTDPNGSPGTPVAGGNAFVWAHVTNRGTSPVRGVQISYWWADPSGQVLRSNSHPIGSAFADLEPYGQPGDEQDVLCLTPWHVTLVNGGHECLIAEAMYPGSSVPVPAPDAFNPPTYVEIAQKNLSVIAPRRNGPMTMLTIAADSRMSKRAVVVAEIGGELEELALARLGLEGFRMREDAGVEVGLARTPACVPVDGQLGDRKLEIEIPRGASIAVYVGIRARDLATAEYTLVRIVEYDDDRAVGGYGYVVVQPLKESDQ